MGAPSRPGIGRREEIEAVKPLVLEVYAHRYGRQRAEAMLEKTLSGIAGFVIDQADAGLLTPLVHTTKDGAEYRLLADDIRVALAPIRNTEGV
jgi:hypothetical protein